MRSSFKVQYFLSFSLTIRLYLEIKNNLPLNTLANCSRRHFFWDFLPIFRKLFS